MRSRLSPLYAALLAVLLTAPLPLAAQSEPSGGGFVASGLIPADELGGGSLVGYGFKGVLGLSSTLSLEASALWGSGELEAGDAVGRDYSLFLPSLNLRASVAGDESDLALLLSPGLMHYDLGAFNEHEGARSQTLPALGLGAAFRTPIAGPLHFEIAGRDWLTIAGDNELGRLPTGDGLTHNPELRISLSALFGPSEPTLSTDVEDGAIQGATFTPVPAEAVTFDKAHAADGRDHAHVKEGEARRLAIDPRPPHAVTIDGPYQPYDATRLGVLHFAPGSTHIREEYRGLIADVAGYLEAHERALLELRSFTDVEGGRKDNLSIAERRGTLIKERLVQLFEIADDRISVVAVGADAQSETAEKARRVEVIAKQPGR